ncbi:MerR family transcriptional regulator [Streptomyces sp. NPDC026673]|uniref:MerR family transcriptional regulator n=1 Tax=Streptomyces sp. NPDC026673 TaxID=3155724 RepID=UPI0033E4CEEA
MIGNDDDRRLWSIGEVARATGTTIRTLRHYDEIGLLGASARTASGHRRYTADDVRRLYRVRALRALGLPLDEIARVLADATEDLESMRALLTAQLSALEAHAGRIGELTAQIRTLLGRMEDTSMPEPEQFMTTLEMMSVFETHFTAEQREQLAGRRAELGPEGVEAAKTEWAGLVRELLRLMEAGTPAGDPGVRDLVGRWDGLANRFHAAGADGERTKAAAQRMWDENSERIGQNLPWSPDRMRALVAYVQEARDAG